MARTAAIRRAIRKTSLLPFAFVLTASACFGPDAQGPPDGVSATPDPLGTITIAPGEPIQLGMMLEGASGPGSTTGLDAARGVQLAVDFLDGAFDGDPGPLLDHPVTVTEMPGGCESRPDAGAPADAVPEELVGVIGPGCAHAVLSDAAAGLAERGVVMISPTATEADLTEPDTRPATFFRTAYNDLLEGAAVADYATGELEAARSGVATDEAGTTGAASSFRTRFEADQGIVAVAGTLQVTTDVTRLMRAIALGRPEFVYLVGRRSECADAAREAAALPSLRGVPVVASAGCFDPAFVVDHAASVLMHLSGPDLTELSDDDFYRMQFLTAYQEQFGTMPVGAFHAQAYDATLMLLDAIDRVAERQDDGTLMIGRTALLDAVSATSGVTGISGTITCTESGDCAPEATIAVFLVPEVPVDGGVPGAEPVFTETVALADLLPES